MEPICHRIRAVAWSSNGRFFAKLDDDGNTDVHESESGAIRWQIAGEDGLFYGFSVRANRMRCWLSNDGSRLLAMNHNGALTEARRDEAEWITKTGTENCYGALAVSEDESAVARAVIIPPRWA